MGKLVVHRISPSKRKTPEVKETRSSLRQGTLDTHVATRASRAKRMLPLVSRGLSGTRAIEKPIDTTKQLESFSKEACQHTSKAATVVANKPSTKSEFPTTKQDNGNHKKLLAKLQRKDVDELLVGDSVYIVLNDGILDQVCDEDDDEHQCMVCGGTEVEKEIMLECGKCLSGWHIACLEPPLQAVPEGDWLCPDCASGKPPCPRQAGSQRELFLQDQGLGLARIEGMWEDAAGEVQCTVRWFEIPEKTHTGRQKHHTAREVFLTQQRDTVSAESLGLKAHVLPPEQFFRGGDALGDNVFMCEYEYDTIWQRFKRRTQFDSDDDDGEEWCPDEGDHPAAEDEDKTCRPIYAYWVEKGMVPPKSMRGTGSRQSKAQGGEAFLEQVGALEIPHHIRRQQGPSSELAMTRDALMLTAVPSSLPCRGKERQEIKQFVQDILDDSDRSGCGKCLYVSGIPGTGKTATVLEVMRGFKRRAEEGAVPHFQFVEINGLRLPSPQHAYSTLYEALTGDRVGPQNAASLLDEIMSGKSKGHGGPGFVRRRHTILLIDEMDLLLNKTQTVLYNLFDWPSRPGSRLSIIGIANTMDLPERLHQRIGSRLAGRRVPFQPYKTEQLQEIIASRLEGLPAFEPQAITLVSRKVANCSGDVRRCLELCRRAAEIAEERWIHQQKQVQAADSPTSQCSLPSQAAQPSCGTQARPELGRVQMRHVNAAVQEMFNTSHVVMIRTSSRLERLLLAALHLEARFSGRSEAVLEDVADRLNQMCRNNMEQHYDFAAVMEAAVRLGSKRLILSDPGYKRLRMKLSLNVPLNDLLHVLKGDEQIMWLAARLDTTS